MAAPNSTSTLRREIGIWGAMFLGLGSMAGTGVFVSLGLGADLVGPAVLLAVTVAALVATCNGLSSAQLAANHPVSGGTYEYGYRYLHPRLGFLAGWMFLIAKSASAATAALGFGGYFLHFFKIENNEWILPLAIFAIFFMTVFVFWGIRQTKTVNTLIVSVTLLALFLYIIVMFQPSLTAGTSNLSPFFAPEELTWQGKIAAFLEAVALMFVAYTGYGRIATLGEEVHQPRTTIPKAIILTLVVTWLLYSAVAAVSVASSGSNQYALASIQAIAPLEVLAFEQGHPIIARLVAFGAITAMLGVLINLILGLSRVLLAMGRRQDMPRFLATIEPTSGTPRWATVVVAFLVGGLVLMQDIRATWSLSAFAVLIYYSVTNLAALRLKPKERFFPAWISLAGLIACFILAFWVDRTIWISGLIWLAVGLLWFEIASRMSKFSPPETEMTPNASPRKRQKRKQQRRR
ncbi:Amino acid ABC transporter system permease [Planctomycetales bacterium 10988]|nr:Amino acid ABC transporter system permease [Planctomycetales bacterium 10988]